MAKIGWKHHTLIQALLFRGPLPEKEVHSIFSGVTGKNPEANSLLFNDYLLKINKELAYVQFELRGCRNQYDGGVYYGVVNNVADEQSKLGSKYTFPQIAFYKAIIEEIVLDSSAQGCIPNISALNIRLANQISGSSQDSQILVAAAAMNKLSLSQKEKTLCDLMHDGWLCHTSNDNIGLGLRSFLDLRSWFRGNDIPACEVCNEAGVKADLCSNDECTVRIHDYCLKKKFSNRKVARLCPECRTPWVLPETSSQYDTDEKENDPYQLQEPSSGSTRREMRRSCKADKSSQTQSKAKQVAARGQSKAAFDGAPNARKRSRRCKAEAGDEELAENTRSQELRRSQRNKRMR